jgi:hypothetical protein
VNTGLETRIETGPNGEYVAPNLIPGEYAITATHTGFSTLSQSGILIHVNERLQVDLNLTVGEITQTVEVTAAPTLLQSESSSVGNVITRREVSELPLNGRSVYQLAYLNAGVTNAIPTQNANNTSIPDNARAQQGLSVNGQRQSNNTFILDGVYNNQINQGLMAILPPLEAVQEFVVETSNFNPEVGRGGGVVNVTLKSGTNSFHGQAFEFMRNSALDARNFFDRTSPRRLPNFVQNSLAGLSADRLSRTRRSSSSTIRDFGRGWGKRWLPPYPVRRCAPVISAELPGRFMTRLRTTRRPTLDSRLPPMALFRNRGSTRRPSMCSPTSRFRTMLADRDSPMARRSSIAERRGRTIRIRTTSRSITGSAKKISSPYGGVSETQIPPFPGPSARSLRSPRLLGARYRREVLVR